MTYLVGYQFKEIRSENMPVHTSRIPINAVAEAFYLDWFNNYLTVERMAEDYGITETLCKELIDRGRELNYKREY